MPMETDQQLGDSEELEDQQDPNLGDEDPDESPDDEDEDEDPDSSGDEGDGAEGGGGDDEDPDGGTPKEPAVPLTGRALVEALFNDEDAKGALQDALADYQRQMSEQANSREEAEKFQKLIDDGDYEGIGRIIIERQQTEAARATVTDALTQEVFNPVYRQLFAQPEMQDLTAEDKERLHLSKFKNHAEHVVALQDFISNKRGKATFDEAVKRGVEEALTAERNKASAEKAKTSSLGARSPVAAGPVNGPQSSADLLKSGLRALINPDDSGDDDE